MRRKAKSKRKPKYIVRVYDNFMSEERMWNRRETFTLVEAIRYTKNCVRHRYVVQIQTYESYEEEQLG